MTNDKKYEYIIYKIYNPDCDYVYVGSTRNMAVRKKCHKSNCNNVNSPKYNYKVYKKIRENDGWENWYMIPIEVMDNVTKLEAEMREDVYRVDLNATMNSNRASCGGITRQEYYKQYTIDNKETIQEHKKKHYQYNKETILTQAKQKITCECGGYYTYTHKSQHIKTKKHQASLLSLAK